MEMKQEDGTVEIHIKCVILIMGNKCRSPLEFSHMSLVRHIMLYIATIPCFESRSLSLSVYFLLHQNSLETHSDYMRVMYMQSFVSNAPSDPSRKYLVGGKCFWYRCYIMHKEHVYIVICGGENTKQ